MIANVSPSSMSYEDTLNTLKYANRAKNIKTTVQRNVVNVNYHVSKYTQIISELKAEVSELKSRLNNQSRANSAPASLVDPKMSIELEERRNQMSRMELNLSQMKEVIKEQYQILVGK
jgi:kinesin family protein 18/19